jgi:hypothetical protein
MEMRAEILETGDAKKKSASIIINAPISEIFNLLANPVMHPVIDGSNSVKSVINGPERLHLGAKFSMNMRIGVKYRITNKVVEFQEGEQIAWQHLGRWIWRYELKEIAPTQTVVIETFDASRSPFQLWLKWRKAYPYVQIAVAKTLVRLKKHLENQ